jgi:hypothetical protein
VREVSPEEVTAAGRFVSLVVYVVFFGVAMIEMWKRQ